LYGTGLVGPGSVWVGCPLRSLRFDCGDSHSEIVGIATITGFCRGNLKVHLEDLGVDGRITLQWILQKWDGTETGLV
jgi:hypothetical protein